MSRAVGHACLNPALDYVRKSLLGVRRWRELSHKIFFENRSLSAVCAGVMHTREAVSDRPDSADKITCGISGAICNSLMAQAEIPW